ncbi:unnamed protein product, partial [Didymodactylos carnosus]
QIDDNDATVTSAKTITVTPTDATSLSDNNYDTTIAACRQHTDISNTSSSISHTLLPASCPEITVALTTDMVGNAETSLVETSINTVNENSRSSDNISMTDSELTNIAAVVVS